MSKSLFCCVLLGLLLLFSCTEMVAPSLRSADATAHGYMAREAVRAAPGHGFTGDSGVRPLSHPGDDELWIIETARSTGEDDATPNDDEPGSGALIVERDELPVPVPLKHTSVRARVDGYMATVAVTQQFANPFAEKIEAVYVFPLPQNAGVHEFVMQIGERRIRGILRERKEAERIYAEARAQGYRASLLTQERPNVFTQRVANIEPGQAIDVHVEYFHTLRHTGQHFEFVFPMVVGPRFNPPGTTDGVGAASWETPGASGQSTEVAYLRPRERSGHDIDLTVELDAGLPLEELTCPTHDVTIERRDERCGLIALAPLDRVPNRDFILRYRVAGDAVRTAWMSQAEGDDGYFSLMIHPPLELGRLPRRPLDLTFVLDCSGSMQGVPLEQAKRTVREALSKLGARDRFQIIRFSEEASGFRQVPVPATEENVSEGLDYLDDLSSGGGTMMIRGIQAALSYEQEPDALRFVAFLTDGYIGNEREILAEVERRLGGARIFSFGIGSSVNRYLLEGLARIGRGAAAFVGPNDPPTVAVDTFFASIARPALCDLEIDWGGLEVSAVYPTRLPDLFVGRPVIITGRYRGALPEQVQIHGSLAGRGVTLDVPTTSGTTHEGLKTAWARRRIADLEDRSLLGDAAECDAAILACALEHGLLSKRTAFLAVDASERTEGTHGTTVRVPVPMPPGVRYDTTVSK
ncbi:MAG: VWA domain-containing protein [Planctomycetes bacterium]|nr:VWA domain-containing protein [Planctomycetota bacterium]